MVSMPSLVRLAGWLHVVDIPSERKVHKVPMPRLGGIAMGAGTVLALTMWAPMQRPMIGFIVGVAIILLFGAWDDIKGIGYRLKFLGQIIAVLVVLVYGGVVIRVVPFFGLQPMPDY